MTSPVDELSIAELGAAGLSPQALALYLLAYAERSGLAAAQGIMQSSAAVAQVLPPPDSTFYAYA